MLKLLTKTVPRIGIPNVVPVHVHLAVAGIGVHVGHVTIRIARAIFLRTLVLFTDSLLPKFLCSPAVAGNVLHHNMIEISMQKYAQAVSYYWQIVILKFRTNFTASNIIQKVRLSEQAHKRNRKKVKD